MNKNSRKTGVSIVEMLVYVALLTSVTTLVVNGLVTMSRSYTDVRLSKNITTSATTALSRMVYEIRQAQSVDATQSTFATSPGQLTLNTTPASGVPTTVKFYVQNSILRVMTGGIDEGPITLSGVTVSNLTFTRVQNSISQAIKIGLTLQTTIGSKTKTETFYTTAVLRNIY
jgi:Tfp pilus assembly protein FimT